jgi:uroporphyrinogen-III decarboxylase
MNSKQTFDTSTKDAQAMPITPVEPREFDFAQYDAHTRACDARYAEFMRAKQGSAVWQRVRAGEVFRDACRDKSVSLRWQLGALKKSLDYLSDAPTYLEPWYGIGTTASAFGAEYEWHEGQAPGIRPIYKSVQEFGSLVPRDLEASPIMRYTLDTIEYFLEQTQGRAPMSWSDIQSPLNVATELVSISDFFLGMQDAPERAREILAAMSDVVIAFTQKQTDLIGNRLVRPGHGFASSYSGTGIAMSTDNLVMLSPRMYERFCIANDERIGSRFGGVIIHSCGNWARWLPVVKRIPNLVMVDGAFSPQTDPDPDRAEDFRDALVNTGITLHARIVGAPEEVLAIVERLWTPGLKLIVVTYEQDPRAQHKLYNDIHSLCS